jgi:hypothetical protein
LIYFQELEASPSASSELECERSPSAKSSPTAAQSSPSIGPECRSTKTSGPCLELMLTSSAAASPAKTSALLEMAQASLDLGPDFGMSTSASSKQCGQNGPLSKTSAPFALGDWKRSSGSSLRSGMTRSGTAFPLLPLARLTKGTASGSSPIRPGIPTPTSRDWKDGSAQSCKNVPVNALLGRWVHMFPTPTWRDSSHARNSTAVRYRPNKGHAGTTLIDAVVPPGGKLNPTFVEWLMGYPLEYSVLEHWETRSSRRSRKS